MKKRASDRESKSRGIERDERERENIWGEAERSCDIPSASLHYHGNGPLVHFLSNYGGIAKSILNLEAIGLELHESLAIVKNVEREIREARGTVAVSIKDKLTKPSANISIKHTEKGGLTPWSSRSPDLTPLDISYMKNIVYETLIVSEEDLERILAQKNLRGLEGLRLYPIIVSKYLFEKVKDSYVGSCVKNVSIPLTETPKLLLTSHDTRFKCLNSYLSWKNTATY
ncbi:hypothetical protein C0J52_15507 [Blattella germanica]|nr:hypothetical protein C0J52_15507 [Blattella germanica]